MFKILLFLYCTFLLWNKYIFIYGYRNILRRKIDIDFTIVTYYVCKYVWMFKQTRHSLIYRHSFVCNLRTSTCMYIFQLNRLVRPNLYFSNGMGRCFFFSSVIYFHYLKLSRLNRQPFLFLERSPFDVLVIYPRRKEANLFFSSSKIVESAPELWLGLV